MCRTGVGGTSVLYLLLACITIGLIGNVYAQDEYDICVVCDSRKDFACAINLTAVQLQGVQCPRSSDAQLSGCFRSHTDDGHVKRGCITDLSPTEAAACTTHQCKRCQGARCNAKINFQYCRTCNSTDDRRCIRSPASTPSERCTDYMDECFTHVRDDVITRGCLADFLAAGKAEDNVAVIRDDCAVNAVGDPDARCVRCANSANCNGRTVDGEFCLRCDTKTDPACTGDVAAHLNHTIHGQCALAVNRKGCYLFNDGAGTVRRGCMSELQDVAERSACRLAGGAQCKTCMGDDCNAKPKFQQCRVCNSTDSAACIRSPGSFPAKVCSDYMEECYTHVERNVTTRGCLSEAPAAIRAECESGSQEFCVSCAQSTDCNRQAVDGEFCYECDTSAGDVNCAAGGNYTQQKQCPLAVGSRGCYLFDEGDGTVRRGCVADLHADEQGFCRRNGETCKVCVGNNCNRKQSFQRCRTCTSEDSVNCIRAAHVAKTVLCRGYTDQCFLHVRNNTVTRGCLEASANSSQIVSDCTELGNDFCDTCDTTSANATCNQRIVDGEFCITCNSTADPDCREKPDFRFRTQCPLAPVERGCFHREVDGVVQRGCVAALPSAAEVTECQSDTDTCKVCLGNDCNSRPHMPQCRVCSSASSVNCIRAAWIYDRQTCRRYNDECYTHVDSNNTVIRGCLGHAPLAIKYDCYAGNPGDPERCDTCRDRVCNDETVDGEFCIECDSETDPNCGRHPNGTMHKQCALSPEPRGCYMFDEHNGNNVKRGCIADLDADEVEMCRSNDEDSPCKTCIGNDCNLKPAFERCRKCSSKDSVNCIRSPFAMREVVCREYLDYCVTHVQNDTVLRGCLKELTKDPIVLAHCSATNGDPKYCSSCRTADNATTTCNSAVVDGEFCLKCDSAIDPACRGGTPALNHTHRVQCPLSEHRRGCYLLDFGEGDVKRGCVADLTALEEVVCQDGNNGNGTLCKTCIGDDCNRKPQFQLCRHCSSTDRLACIRSPLAVPLATCKSYTDTCFVHARNGVVTRGCRQEHLPADDAGNRSVAADDCAVADSGAAGPKAGVCTTCSAPDRDCNNRLVDGEFCIECDSAVDARCLNATVHSMHRQCPLAAAARGCYLQRNGTEARRGCVADLEPLAAVAEACTSQSDTCKTCVGNDCNSRETFQRCRVCNSTQNANCIRSPGSFLSQQCRFYDDECYTHAIGNVVTRGCRRQAPAPVLTDCAQRPDLCERCSGPLCNQKTVDGEFCLECDQKLDANCATNGNYTMRKQCPLAVHQRGCYLWDEGNLSQGGELKRGCVADLSDDEIGWCTLGWQDECRTCEGNDCNARASFSWCKKCDSTTNVDCIRATRFVRSLMCDRLNDQCYTHVSGNVTTRGCLSEADEPKRKPCADGDAETCETCRLPEGDTSQEPCNTKIVDGEFCASCNSNSDRDCRANVTLAVRKQCDLSVAPLGCYDWKNGSRIERGCISDLTAAERSECRANGDCQICEGNECNVRTDFAECVVCDSATDKNCVALSDTVDRYLNRCEGYTDRCYTRIDGERVTRGCQPATGLDAEPAASAAPCSDPNDEACSVCDGIGCNRLSVEPEFCLTCTSESSGADCGARPKQAETLACSNVTAYSHLRRGCFHHIDEETGLVARGCVTHLNADRRAYCARQLDCKSCDSRNDCNERVAFQQCYVCTSLSDPLCVGNVAAAGKPAQCRKYEDTCTQLVRPWGLTVRECTDAVRLLSVQQKEECTQSGCNGDVYPKDRKRCHQCGGGDCDAQLTAQSGTLRECKEYLENDMCYAFAGANGSMYRGCHSDRNRQKHLCNAAGSSCLLCDTADGCNDAPGLRAPQLSCVQCADALGCGWGHRNNSSSAALPCKQPVRHGHHEHCYATLHNATGIATRGCHNDDRPDTSPHECPPDVDICQYCIDDGCNAANLVQQHCERCNSSLEADAKCGDDGVEQFVQLCPLPSDGLIEYADRGCYTQKRAGVVTRGCTVELTTDERKRCADDKEAKNCQLCTGDDCNTKKPPSGAAAVRAMWSLVMALSLWVIAAFVVA